MIKEENVYEITSTVYTASCPLAINSIESFLNSNPDGYYISLLEIHETPEYLNSKNLLSDLRFIRFPIPDFGTPGLADVAELFELLKNKKAGKIIFQCMGGIGRSSLMAAAYLCSKKPGINNILEKIGLARGQKVPETAAQLVWLYEFEKYIAGNDPINRQL